MMVSGEIARELRYELAMAEYTHKQLAEWAIVPGRELALGTSSAFLESFIAHARLLDEFLGGRQREPRRDDVTASGLSKAWAGSGFLSEEDRTRTDKQMLHLTTARDTRQQWPVLGIARALASTYLEFYKTLDTSSRHELEGTKLNAERILARCDDSHVTEVYLGLVWRDTAETGLAESSENP